LVDFGALKYAKTRTNLCRSFPGPDEPQTDTDFQLHLAIQHALSDAKEGPWYGVYNLLLRPLEIVQRGTRSATATVMFPQHPVAISIFELDDDHIISYPTSSSSIDAPAISASPVQTPSTPITTRRARAGKHAAIATPSPDQLDLISGNNVASPSHPVGLTQAYDNIAPVSSPDIATYSDPLSPHVGRLHSPSLHRTNAPTGVSPASSPGNPFYNSPVYTTAGLVDGQNILEKSNDFLRHHAKRRRVSESGSDPSSPPRAPIVTVTSPFNSRSSVESIHDGVLQQLRIRATQIPDFLRYVFLSTKKGVIKRVDLIVENKRTYRDRDRYLVALAVQTFRQAQFVFENDSEVQVIACLMAIGEYWSYREVQRSTADTAKMEEEVLKARGADTPYKPSPEPTHSDASFVMENAAPVYPFQVNQFTTSDAFTQLQEAFPLQSSMISIRDEITATLIDVIRTRLQEINEDMWPDDEGGPSESSSDD
jgi:hypothetical protein